MIMSKSVKKKTSHLLKNSNKREASSAWQRPKPPVAGYNTARPPKKTKRTTAGCLSGRSRSALMHTLARKSSRRVSTTRTAIWRVIVLWSTGTQRRSQERPSCRKIWHLQPRSNRQRRRRRCSWRTIASCSRSRSRTIARPWTNERDTDTKS